MATIISRISDQGGSIENVKIYRSTLEDVFMKLTGKSLVEEEANVTIKEDDFNV